MVDVFDHVGVVDEAVANLESIETTLAEMRKLWLIRSQINKTVEETNTLTWSTLDPDDLEDVSKTMQKMLRGKYSSEGAAREWSTVVDISIPPPSFKPVSLYLSRSPLSKTPKQVFFNPINIFDSFNPINIFDSFTHSMTVLYTFFV